jgi:hypothetical protein
MTRPLLAAAALLTLCTAARADQELRFRGEMVQEPKTGFTVLGEKKDGIIAVTSAAYHYSLVLPWQEEWTFTVGDSPLLKGSSGLVNLTLSVEECDESPEDHLRTVKARLADSGRMKGVERSEIVTFKKEPVLRMMVDAAQASGKREFRGVKMIHLHSVERVGRLVYVLHLSRVIPAEEVAKFDDKLMLSFATVGFRSDFMRGE